MTDREAILQQRQEQQLGTLALDLVTQQEALGIGMAAFCQTFLAALLAPESILVTRDEALWLLAAALQGRG